MTRLVFLVLPLVGLLGAWMGAVGKGNAVAPVLSALLGLFAASAIWMLAARRTRALSRAVNAWMGKIDVEPVDVDGGPDHRELATALNTLGAAYGRRGQRLEQSGPEIVELIAALPEPAFLITREGVVVASNEPARQLLGAPEGHGLTATQALGSAPLVELVEHVAAGGEDLAALEVHIGRRVIEARATTFADHVLLLVRDLTEGRRIAALRRDFVTNASHELKTPVAGIQSLADAIDVVLETDPVRARQLLGRLRGESDRLSSLVGDLLSLRRVDDEASVVEAEVVDVERLAAEALANVTVAADERHVEVELEVEAPVRVRAVADDVRLVLANLVDNAVKYNRPGGRVTVSAAVEGERVRIEVRDTGIGIPSVDLERVFERFYRVDPGRSRDAGGTGLGLAIVRHAVERSGGEVAVTSLVGTGTTFTVWLPVAQDESA